MLQQGSKRIRLVETPQASLDLEFNSKYAILHLPRVDKFQKGEFKLFKDYLVGLAEFFEVSNLEGPYAATEDKKIEKLAKRLGFDYLGESNGLKVYKYATSSNGNRGGIVSSFSGSSPASR